MTPISIEPYQTRHLTAIQDFVEIIQDTESSLVEGLKSGSEIKEWYAQSLVDSTESKQGVILVALAEPKLVSVSKKDSGTDSKPEAELIGFVCAWVEDDDKLVLDSLRQCAYISDICVSADWRGHGVAAKLLQAIEKVMQALGCQRIRLCAKRGNLAAIKCYEGQGYQTYETILAKQLA
ncbi:MAG: GNAT family N-acetyltransferase [Candidatus Obscuribacterales bacterium]|jgi:ribosomal protein S18 acetylase RimI-like enzyme